MSIESKLCAVVAALTVVGGVGAVETLSASAATPACGPGCISIFSRELGTYAQPGPVEDVLDGVVRVGQPVILKAPASASDPSQDTIPHRRPVSEWYADGMVSAAVNAHYGSLPGVQIESAPYGMPSGLCVALASIAYQNEALTLQPCNVPNLTVWVLDTPDSASTAPAWFPIVNASTTDFGRPFAMSLKEDEIVSNRKLLHIRVRHLQFLTNEKTLPDSQLWGAHFGQF
jgi:hypothetical protein